MKDDHTELAHAQNGGRVVPLGPEARAVLSALPREDDNPWVIAGRLSTEPAARLKKPATRSPSPAKRSTSVQFPNYWTEVWRLILDPDDIPIKSCSRAGNAMPVGKIKRVDEVLHRI